MDNYYINNGVYITDINLFKEEILYDKWERVFNLLNNNLISINYTFSNGKAFVHHAVIHNNKEVLLKLINYGADLSIQDKHGMSALHYGVSYVSFDCIKILLLNNINVNLLDNRDRKAHEYLCFGSIDEEQNLNDNLKKSFFLICIEYGYTDILTMYKQGT